MQQAHRLSPIAHRTRRVGGDGVPERVARGLVPERVQQRDPALDVRLRAGPQDVGNATRPSRSPWCSWSTWAASGPNRARINATLQGTTSRMAGSLETGTTNVPARLASPGPHPLASPPPEPPHATVPPVHHSVVSRARGDRLRRGPPRGQADAAMVRARSG